MKISLAFFKKDATLRGMRQGLHPLNVEYIGAANALFLVALSWSECSPLSLFFSIPENCDSIDDF